MASNIMDSVVELTVNDVPGAAFMYSDIKSIAFCSYADG